MNQQLKQGILEGRVILFLGAGASIGSMNSKQKSPPLGYQLAEKIAHKVGWEYTNESLGVVYSAAKKHLAQELDSMLVELYRNCNPSKEYEFIASIPWARIYTTNIDDAFEHALFNNSEQSINIKNRNDRVEDKAQLFDRLEYVYLNGTIKQPDNGFVFSPEEYGKTSANNPQWYNEVASDYLQCTFIFIGTKLDEPAFLHHVERYKERAGKSAPLSYVITPNATEIQKASFESYGLEHIAGTLSDFCVWLKDELQPIPSYIDVAQNKFPELKAALSNVSNASKKEKAELMRNVVLVSRQSLAGAIGKTNAGTIRGFYKGFKPSWSDILDGVPAELKQFTLFINKISEAKKDGKKLVALIGPAGCGKSTFLKMAALRLSDNGEKIYYLSAYTNHIAETIRELELSNSGRYFIFIERIDPVKNILKGIVEDIKNGLIVSAEGQNIWHSRASSSFDSTVMVKHDVLDISEEDVPLILDKIKSFGSWTRLANMSNQARKKEIYIRSKRQLLIGLMEATTGIGFEEIIQREYETIVSDNDRFFFVLVCIATMHRANLSLSLSSRSLSSVGIDEAPITISSRLKGMVEFRDNGFVVRHPLYARKVVESVVDRKLIASAIESILDGFKVYNHPVVKKLNKNDSALFKAIINHRYLADVLRNDKDEIYRIYSTFEKFFENDGLYWLQYGLSKRSFGDNKEAFDILQTAFDAYPHDHTTHALALQKIILASTGLVSNEMARHLLAEAVSMLEKLDQILESDDTYPIVTLAEGHVATLRSIDGDNVARIKAKEYFDIIENRFKDNYDKRLKDSKSKLLKYATTGAWSDELVKKNIAL